MSPYWSSFAVSVDPATGLVHFSMGLVQWPNFTTESKLTLLLHDMFKGGFRVEQGILLEQCEWYLQCAISIAVCLPDAVDHATSMLDSEFFMTGCAAALSRL